MGIIGQKILIKRKELGLTQEELAHKMGYKSKSTINKIELGINDVPYCRIIQFAKILDTSVAELIEQDLHNSKDDLSIQIIISTSKTRETMYSNLNEEMIKKGFTIKKIAIRMNIDPRKLSAKLKGKELLSVLEAQKIKKVIGSDLPLEVLFEGSK